MGLHSDDPNELTMYADADWGCDIDNRQSVSSYVFLLGDSAISWSAKKQPTVAGSSTKAEYMSLSHAAQQGLWIHHLLIELSLELESIPTTIFVDN